MNILKKKYAGIICIICVLFCILLADFFMKGWNIEEKKIQDSKSSQNNEKTEDILHADFLNERATEFCNEYMKYIKCSMEYKIVVAKPARAEILYYAVNEDAHITVWKESIAFYEKDGAYTITQIDRHCYESIRDVEHFYSAYPDGVIDRTPMDYITNGLGKELNKKAKESPEMYGELFEPVSAARYLLNLTNDEALLEITTSTNNETGVVQICLRFGNGSESQYAFVQMIQPFGKKGIWIPQTLEGEFEYTKKMIRIYSADLDHDGELEEIDISFNGCDQDTNENIEERIAYGGLTGQVEVLETESLDVIYKMGFAGARTGNGQLLLVRKDGKSYLLKSDINEQMGDGNYSYEVFYFENGAKKIVDEYSVSFAESEDAMERNKEHGRLYLRREDVVPKFKEHIEKWFDDAFILVCADINNNKYQEVYISSAKKQYRPDEYYQYVWKRNTESPRIFKNDFVEGMDVHIMEIAQVDGATYEIEELVEATISSKASADWGIRMLFGNESDYLYFYESHSPDGINPFMGNEEMFESVKINNKELILGKLNDRIIGSYEISSGCGVIFNLDEKFWNDNKYVISFLIESTNTEESFLIRNSAREEEKSYDDLFKKYEDMLYNNR